MLRVVDRADVGHLARGCAILGTGGGGEVYTGSLILHEALRRYGPVPVVTLEELDPEGLLPPLGSIGAPTVGVEKLPSGDEGMRLRDHLQHVTGRTAVAVMSSEIGGSNGLEPIAWAAEMGLPIVDADSMGRAFPEVQQVTQYVTAAARAVRADGRARQRGDLAPSSGPWAERIGRAVTVARRHGRHGGLRDDGRRGDRRGHLRLAHPRARDRARDRRGRGRPGLRARRGRRRRPPARRQDRRRRAATTAGFARGSVLVEGSAGDSGRLLRLEIQNENLVALEDGLLRASVPDLITVVDSTTGEAIATELVAAASASR